MQFIFKNKNNR